MDIPSSAPTSGIKPCRLYAQGRCRYGTSCKFRHDSDSQDIRKPTPRCGNERRRTRGPTERLVQLDRTSVRQSVASSSSGVSPSFSNRSAQASSSKATTRSKRGERACRAWKAGHCAKGDKCWFGHDPEVQAAEHRRKAELARREEERMAQLAREEEQRQNMEREAEQQRNAERLLAEERERARQALVAEQEAAQRVRLAERVKEDAAKTIQTVILGSIVTFGAGLDVRDLITGFESCTITVKNLPPDARLDEVSALFTQQGIDEGRFHVVGLKKTPDGKQAADIIADAEYGGALAAGLDDIEFRDEKLVFEVGAYNSPGGMGATASRDGEILTISWRAPSVVYVAEYDDIQLANTMVRDLHRRMCSGRRIKVQMNTLPPGRSVKTFRPNSIKIMNLPLTVTDSDIMDFSGCHSVRRLKGTHYDLSEGTRLLQERVESLSPGGIVEFNLTSNSSNPDGHMSARVQFSSWDEAQKVQTCLADWKLQFLGNSPLWFRLPNPNLYTIIIPAEQYRAQRAQWKALVDSIKDKDACSLYVNDNGAVVRIRLSGSVKQAVGALKVRVESLADGEKVDGWHQTLRNPKAPFIRSVYEDTGAFVRADWRKQTLKIYGEPKAAERAREAIKAELDRLSALEYTVTLQQKSVGFFLRHGVSALKETFGEDAVRLVVAMHKITVTGGEEARHHLHSLIDESVTVGLAALPRVDTEQLTCPICYDDVSSPVKLGCGHVYCTACLRHFLTSAMDSDNYPLVCMGDESRCGVPIAIPTISKFLPPGSFARLLELVFIAHVGKHPQELKYCTTPDCTQIYRSSGHQSPASLQCPSCFSTVCSSCHEEAHEGMTCEMARLVKNPAEQERLNDEWITQQGGRVKRCPECSVPIEKTEGCNHMTCRCGAHICWRCMGVFTADTIYPHMNDVHDGIYDRAPVPDPDIDLEEQLEVLRLAEERRRRVEALREQAARPVLPARPYEHAAHAYGHEERQPHLANPFDAHWVAQQQEQERERELRRQREVREAWERRVREHEQQQLEQRERLRREEEQRRLMVRFEAEARRQREQEQNARRRQQEQEQGGWCTIM